MARRHRRDGSVLEAAAKGAVAGMIGGMAMMMVMKGGQKALLPEEERMEPPPKQFVEEMAERAGGDLSGMPAMAAGMGVHLGYSALWGALHGVGQRALRLPVVPHGLFLGGLVYAANFPEFGLLPQLGVRPPPSEHTPEQAAIPVGAHLVFGLATAAAYEALA